jgi:hypothetical protein
VLVKFKLVIRVDVEQYIAEMTHKPNVLRFFVKIWGQKSLVRLLLVRASNPVKVSPHNVPPFSKRALFHINSFIP